MRRGALILSNECKRIYRPSIRSHLSPDFTVGVPSAHLGAGVVVVLWSPRFRLAPPWAFTVHAVGMRGVPMTAGFGAWPGLSAVAALRAASPGALRKAGKDNPSRVGFAAVRYRPDPKEGNRPRIRTVGVAQL